MKMPEQIKCTERDSTRARQSEREREGEGGRYTRARERFIFGN